MAPSTGLVNVTTAVVSGAPLTLNSTEGLEGPAYAPAPPMRTDIMETGNETGWGVDVTVTVGVDWIGTVEVGVADPFIEADMGRISYFFVHAPT